MRKEKEKEKKRKNQRGPKRRVRNANKERGKELGKERVIKAKSPYSTKGQGGLSHLLDYLSNIAYVCLLCISASSR